MSKMVISAAKVAMATRLTHIFAWSNRVGRVYRLELYATVFPSVDCYLPASINVIEIFKFLKSIDQAANTSCSLTASPMINLLRLWQSPI